jgi:prepilin-type N-terminal cleavage/methylation domain-containing protein
MNPVSPHPIPKAGFTLVEMLVSVTVLVLIMTFIAQMMNSATISTTLSSRHVDTDAEARLVFDRMGADFGRMSHRTDVDFVFTKQPDLLTLATSSGTTGSTSGTDAQMFFYSEAPSYPATTTGSDESTVALIGYTINTTGTSYVPAYSMQRLSKGLTLTSSTNQASGGTDSESNSMIFLTSTGQGGLPIPSSALVNTESAVLGVYPDPPVDMSDYDLLSPEVIRMDFVFEVKDLTSYNTTGRASTVYSNFPCAFFQKGSPNIDTITDISPPQNPVTGPHPAVGDRWYDTSTNRVYRCTDLISSTSNGSNGQTIPIWTPNGMSDVNAIVVTIAILDQRSRKIIPPGSPYLASIASAFLAPTEASLNPKIQSTNSTTEAQLTADLWQTELNTMLQPDQSTGIPTSILGQVRIYQRFFYLNNN